MVIVQESNRRPDLVNTYWTRDWTTRQIPGVPYLNVGSVSESQRDRVEIKSVECILHTLQSSPHHPSDDEEDGEGHTCHVSHQYVNLVTKQEFLPNRVITLKCWCPYSLVLGPFLTLSTNDLFLGKAIHTSPDCPLWAADIYNGLSPIIISLWIKFKLVCISLLRPP